jgi:hypothetical protein
MRNGLLKSSLVSQLYDAPPLGDEFLGVAKIVFGIHLSK